MAAKGSLSKEIITNKILETFDGAFVNDKEIRIPLKENGEEVQIKVTLVAAKDNIPHGGNAPMATAASNDEGDFPKSKVHATEEEKEAVRKMMEALGI